MNPVVLIVEWHTPELLGLLQRSLARFAPEVIPVILPGGPGAEHHARAIHEWRQRGAPGDPVILLDTDTLICSPCWWPYIKDALEAGCDVVGGPRSRGEACQMFHEDGRPQLHASMLAIRRPLFDWIPTFHAQAPDPELGCVTADTAWQVSLFARQPRVVPFRTVAKGPLFWGLQVGEYGAHDGPVLWAHLWRGTGMPVGGPVRQVIRRVRAACGSPRAITTLRTENRRRAWLTGAEALLAR